MSCRGVHFAIHADQAERLLNAPSDKERLDILCRIENEGWRGDADYAWAFETDKAWDAMHRCLTDGTLDSDDGPLAKFVLGGKSLLAGDGYLMILVSPDEARAAALAAHSINETWMRERYFRLSADDTGYTIDETDFQYTWDYFRGLPAFFERAAAAERFVVFTVAL